MKKKILFLTLFILIILLCNNSYAFDSTNLNYDYLYNTDNYTIEEFIDFFKQYFVNILHDFDYFLMFQSSSDIYIYCSYTPMSIENYNATNYKVTTLFEQRDYSLYGVTDDKVPYIRFTINSSGISNLYNGTTLSAKNLLSISIYNHKMLYSNYDIINNSDNTIFFAKNFDLQSSSEESEPIDMTEIIAPLEHIKALLFYICLYLLCKTIYGVIWWIYKKTIL